MLLLSTIMSVSSSIVVVGLNAALQKRFVLPHDNNNLIPGNVHRAASVATGVGGKGQDVAIALSCLEVPQVLLAQFVGQGGAGDMVCELLRQALGDGWDKGINTVRSRAALRTCTSIIGSDTTTELVEPSGTITQEEYQDLLNRLSRHCSDSNADALCVMGTMPPGCPPDTYAQIYETVVAASSSSSSSSSKTRAKPSLLCLIDSVVGLEPLLSIIGSHNSDNQETSNQTLLKINASELCRLAGVAKSTSEAGGVSAKELVEAVQALLKQWSQARGALNGIAITDGAHPAYLATLHTDDDTMRLHRLPVPDVNTCRSSSGSQDNEPAPPKLFPIGAGDAVAAGTLAAWKSLTHTPPCLPDRLQKMLLDRVVSSTAAAAPETTTTTTPNHHQILLTSFAFGLACGTASCLQEENSVLEFNDVEQFFQNTASSETLVVSTHTLVPS